jgi:hypothetical protein
MNLRILLAQAWFPKALKRRKLLALAGAAADAFSAARPDFGTESFGAVLDRFADLADEWSRKAVREDRELEVAEKLFENARRLGEEARRLLRPKGATEVMKAARVLYSAIGIDFEGDEAGSIVIGRCGFSGRFTPEACRVMSSMDAGLLAGLAGRGSLEFSARLTEGAGACRARFSMGGKEP